jgi:hypothetical protein
MGSTSSTTYTWACDLCGADAGTTNKSDFRPPDSLYRFKFAMILSSGREHAVPVDLCAECMKRPITDLAAHLDSKAAS